MKKTWRSFPAVCVVTVLLVPAVAPIAIALAGEANTAERAGEFAAEVNAVNGDIVSMNY